MSDNSLEFYSVLNDNQYSILDRYLKHRFATIASEEKVTVVFDLLHQCNLNCLGCGTNSKTISEFDPALLGLSTEDVFRILDILKAYESNCGKRIFVNFGGGEPYLRSDIKDILRYAAELFGCDGVGIDTNASLSDSYEQILETSKYLSYIGVSINGLQEYHNWWSNKLGFDAYRQSLKTVKKLCSDEKIAKRLEVTSVVTKKNIGTIPQLMRVMANIGVKNYSVHRVVPVGRMEKLTSGLIPSWKDYLFLLVAIIETSAEIEINAHLHHSIESIHASLMCGINTVSKNRRFEKNYRSSIGIDCSGNILVNPWCTGEMWASMIVGNLCSDSRNIHEIIKSKEQLFELMKTAFIETNRCHGCKHHCSGGSRIIAAATWLKDNKMCGTEDALALAFQEIDPACPMIGLERR